MLKRDFTNGDGIILLHRALVKSNFDGLKFWNPRFSWFSDFWLYHRASGSLIFKFEYTRLLHTNTRKIPNHEKCDLRTSQNVKNRPFWKRCAQIVLESWNSKPFMKILSFVILIIRNFDTLESWTFKDSKLWNLKEWRLENLRIGNLKSWRVETYLKTYDWNLAICEVEMEQTTFSKT